MDKYKFVYEDPIGVNVYTPMTARVWIEEQLVLRQSAQQALCPFNFIVGEKEDVVRNDYIEEFAGLASNVQNEFHQIDEADHTTLIFDENFGSQTIRHTIKFLDKITGQRQLALNNLK